MKKTVLTVLLAMFVLGTVGCSRNRENTLQTTGVQTTAPSAQSETSYDDVTSAPIIETASETETATQSVPTETVAPEENSITINTEIFTNGNCSVTLVYPFYGDGEHETFDISMRNYAMQKYNQSGMMSEDNAVYEIISCDIKFVSDYFMSAVISGHIINTTSANDSYFAYTVNSDPRTGRVFLPEELIEDVEAIKIGISERKFEQTYGIDGLMDEITPEDITLSWRTDYGVFPNVYFTESTFGVLMEVAHVLGGYAGFEIPYSETSEMINLIAKGNVGLIIATN